ncbi:MAG TPA: competence/damage-inducible protein A [Bacteroidia bacterium]|nr:competence/damage-inducible protein A [Bacteroidia bacterium]
MKIAEIITIGDELLIGQVVDTNSAWMGQKLNAIGVKVKQITSVSDDESHILSALQEARSRADVILITGGLGPTKDDITKVTLCKYFNTSLRFDQASYDVITEIFKARGRDVSALNRKQAEVPANCQVLLNKWGTAPGMWFNDGEKIFVSMPGVPYEMTGIMENIVLPKLMTILQLPPILHRTILTQGIGESNLSELIAKWEDALPGNMKLAYLPSPGMVRLRITAVGPEQTGLDRELDVKVDELKAIAGEYIYGYEDDTLEAIVGKLLREQGATLATAESCTGGYIAHKITSVPGSSDYYLGSIIAYAYRIKEEFLDVDPEILTKHGAVSEEAVSVMARQVQQKFGANYAIACSGIAGPGGGTEEKPVGTVWIALATPNQLITRKLLLGRIRQRVIMEASQHALNLLRKALLGLI